MPRQLPLRALAALGLLAVLATGLGGVAPTARAQEPPAGGPIDLMFLLDASNSISPADWQLQKDGYAAALQDAVAFPRDGSIAIGLVQWSSTVTLEIPLTVVDGQETVDRLAAEILAIEQIRGGTNTGDGVVAGIGELTANGREDVLGYLCTSTDGVLNGGVSLAAAFGPFPALSVDRHAVVAIEDPGEGFDAEAAQAEYGPYVFGGGAVTVARNTAEFTSLIVSGCLNPALRLAALEVTQATQDWTNSVPLVAGKATVVRAFVETVAGDPVRSTGRLYGTRDGVALPGSPLAAVNEGATVRVDGDIAERRRTLDATLNFLLPAPWREGDVELRIEAPGGLTCAEASPPAGDCAAAVRFDPQEPLRVELVSVGYDEGGERREPSSATLREQGYRLRTAFPVAVVDAGFSSLQTDFSGPPALEDVNAVLALDQLLDDCDPVCERFYHGVLVGGGGGLANGVPGSVSSAYLSGTGPRDAVGYTRNRGPHEVAHMLGRSHAVSEDLVAVKRGECEEFASVDAPDYPFLAETEDGALVYPLGPLGDDVEQVWGFDTRFVRGPTRLAVVDPRTTFSLMSYCPPLEDGQGRWTDAFTYPGLVDPIRAAADGIAGEPARILAPGPTQVVRGRVDLVTGAASFDPAVGYLSATPLPQPPPGDYTLDLLDAAGQVLDSIAFAPTVMEADEPPGGSGVPPRQALFVVPVTDPGPALQRLVVRRGGVEIGSLAASATAPVVAVVAPAEGDALTGDEVTLAWTAEDADGDALRSTVQYSADDGATWSTLAVDLSATSLNVARSSLAGSTTARVRVLASDGLRTAAATSGRFSVGDNAPELDIESPVSGEVFSGAQQVPLEARAWDPEDGTLTGAAIRWSSDLDGPLGSGEELTVLASDLVEGRHVLSATAVDAAGNTTTAEVAIEVVRVAAPPPVTDVTAPALTVPGPVAVDATGPAGALVDYTVTAADDTDASPTVTCAPPAGGTFAIGVTVVACTATDDAGNAASASFEVTVRGAAEQLDRLAAAVADAGFADQAERRLGATARLAARLARAEATGTSCLLVGAFQRQVRALPDDPAIQEQADRLITDATRIRAVLGCGSSLGLSRPPARPGS